MKASQYLISRIDHNSYAIDISVAQEVLHAGLRASEPVSGCFFIRFSESVLPVVDLHWFFSGTYEVLKMSTRLILVESPLEGFHLWGIQAPGLTEVEALSPKKLPNMPAFVNGVSQGSTGEVFHVDVQAVFEKLVASLPVQGRACGGQGRIP